MAEIGSQAAKIGIFVISVVAILVLALLTIGGLRFLRPLDHYHVITDEGVSGIEVNSAVTMRGVTIGEVTGIELDRHDFGRVTIHIAIDPKVRIPSDSRAYFERVGVTGERAINITGGTLAAGELPPGSAILRGQTELERLQSWAQEFSDELSTLITDVTATVNHLEALVAAVDPEHVAGVVEAVDPERVAAIVGNTEQLTENIASAGRQLERAVAELRVNARDVSENVTENLDAVAANATTTLTRVSDAADALVGMIDDAHAILSANAEEVNATLQNLRQASQDATALMDRLREQPSLLLRRPKPTREQRREERARRKQERRQQRQQ